MSLIKFIKLMIGPDFKSRADQFLPLKMLDVWKKWSSCQIFYKPKHEIHICTKWWNLHSYCFILMFHSIALFLYTICSSDIINAIKLPDVMYWFNYCFIFLKKFMFIFCQSATQKMRSKPETLSDAENAVTGSCTRSELEEVSFLK